MNKYIKILACLVCTVFNITLCFSQFGPVNMLINYPFDGDVTDTSGNNYDGFLSGATFGPDRFGNPNSAIYFDGIDDYVRFPNLNSLKPNLSVSFSFWIKYNGNSVSDQAVFNTSFQEDFSSGVFFNSTLVNGNYAINYGDGSSNYTSSTRRSFVSDMEIDIKYWHHVVIIVNSASSMKIYIDCVDYGGTYSGSGRDLFYSNTPGSLGRHDRTLGAPADYFRGAIDDFMYFDRTITLDEINNYCMNLSVNDVERNLSNIVIYPNPSNNIVNIESNGAQVEFITLYNSLGQLLLHREFSPELDVSELSKGIYFVTLTNGDKTEKRKLVIN
jgi:hypothetical protein